MPARRSWAARVVLVCAALLFLGAPPAGALPPGVVELGPGSTPWAFVDQNGTRHVTWVERVEPGPTHRLHYRRQPQGSREFGPDVVLPGISGSVESPRIVEDRVTSRLLLIFGQSTIGGLFGFTSDDGGVTWQGPQTLYSEAPGSSAWEDGCDQCGSTPVSASDGSLSFLVGFLRVSVVTVPRSLAPVTSAPPSLTDRLESRVEAGLAADLAAGSPLLSVFDTTEGVLVHVGTEVGRERDVLVAAGGRSPRIAGTNDGAAVLSIDPSVPGPRALAVRTVGRDGTVGAPVRLSPADDTFPSAPALSADGAGGLHAVWRDSDMDLVYSRSPDDGRSWRPERVLVSASDRDATLGPPTATVAVGGPGQVIGLVAFDTLDAFDRNAKVYALAFDPTTARCEVAPSPALPGGVVTIAGSGFGAAQGGNTVSIGGATAQVASWSGRRIAVVVPALAPGPATVQVTVGGEGVCDGTSTVMIAAPAPQPPIPNPVVISLPDVRTIFFDASLSVDADSAGGARAGSLEGGFGEAALGPGIRRVLWRFGDNTTSTRSTGTHTYTRAATTYRPSVTVTDSRGQTATSVVRVTRPSRPRPIDIAIPSQVVFDFGSARLRRQSRSYLGTVARLGRASRTVRIAGYTDPLGPAAFNLRLSRNRARAVRTFLIGPGHVPARLVRAGGRGETTRFGSARTQLGLQRNRRVIVSFTLRQGVRRI